MTNSRDSLSSVVFGMVVVLASVPIVSTISLQNVTASSCSSLLRDADLDMVEAAEAQNTTTSGATNQTTTNGNMTGTDTTGNTSANELGRISGTDGTVSVIDSNTETPITTLP